MKKLVRLIIFSFLFTGLVGCTGPELLIAPLVNGIIAWKEGEAHKYYANDTHALYRATKRSLLEMNIPIIKDDGIDEDGNYYIKAGANDKFKINIIKVEPIGAGKQLRIYLKNMMPS